MYSGVLVTQPKCANDIASRADHFTYSWESLARLVGTRKRPIACTMFHFKLLCVSVRHPTQPKKYFTCFSLFVEATRRSHHAVSQRCRVFMRLAMELAQFGLWQTGLNLKPCQTDGRQRDRLTSIRTRATWERIRLRFNNTQCGGTAQETCMQNGKKKSVSFAQSLFPIPCRLLS